MSQQRRFLPSDPPLGPLDNREISGQEMEEAESTVNEYLQDPAAFDAANSGGRSTATATINTLSFQQTDPTVSDNTSITHSTTQTLPNEDEQAAEMGFFLAAHATANHEQVLEPSTNQPTSRVKQTIPKAVTSVSFPAVTTTKAMASSVALLVADTTSAITIIASRRLLLAGRMVVVLLYFERV
ncbi:hypothetical protein AUEXF2481DRAFT_83008 [Aureobasidium subglaciale EXF-2481]|uniref:Uncharacterized protein n=1 Tax=Aureobasidium subglaciale (strain EXF-2481) TaxID=1043005 RepID=A0A074Y6H1_AURSE|nr:uncharacterized protein AUEXF2481DRAFT_83008 [Aureobasidium subglaciale EXF-2481]KEQ91554.1 hypothetical protein AUEXF2481DRAFT_83008 [Aureobasidium subglaciale EXF-2481]